MLILRSPASRLSKITIPPEVANLATPYNGRVLSGDNEDYLIENNIIDVLGEEPLPMTWAQKSNKFRLTARFYENTWRLKSISKISGKDFTFDDERALLLEWLQPRAGGIYLDLGCSTALYARIIATHQPGSINAALDFSLPMLQSARKKCLEVNTPMYLIYADARELPFFDDYFDGITCGGTLNELSDPSRVLKEARRVIKPGGIFFIMFILHAKTAFGTFAQSISSTGGLTFYTPEESDTLFRSAGFQVEEEKDIGAVRFAKLKAV